MPYLLAQIFLCLLIAFLIGLLIGWWIARSRSSARIADLEQQLRECRDAREKAQARQPVAAAAAAVAATPRGEPDDLKVIWGIGAKMEELLNDAGIETFAELARTPVPRLREIVAAYGSKRLTDIANEEVWPEQAAIAARGDWDALKEYQANLSWKEGGGRPTDDA